MEDNSRIGMREAASAARNAAGEDEELAKWLEGSE